LKGQGKHLVDDENHGSINLKMPHNWLAERERKREEHWMEGRDVRRTKDSPGEIPVDKTVIGRGSSR